MFEERMSLSSLLIVSDRLLICQQQQDFYIRNVVEYSKGRFMASDRFAIRQEFNSGKRKIPCVEMRFLRWDENFASALREECGKQMLEDEGGAIAQEELMIENSVIMEAEEKEEDERMASYESVAPSETVLGSPPKSRPPPLPKSKSREGSELPLSVRSSRSASVGSNPTPSKKRRLSSDLHDLNPTPPMPMTSPWTSSSFTLGEQWTSHSVTLPPQ
jgi:hypothetical protein